MNEDFLIIRADVDSVMYSHIVEKTRAARQAENLVIAMETPGGDPMYAYRAMNYLRKEYKHIDFVVFDIAMSAGTLMALGADRICFANGACLGPLDLQISHPNPADDTRISTLDVRDTARQTVLEASQTASSILLSCLRSGLPRTLSFKMAESISAKLYRPIMDKIDPFHLHESYRNAELSITYGSRLLLSGMIKDKSIAVMISSHLANNYSSHGYAIMEEEAKEIGLKVINISEMSNAQLVEDAYNRVQYGEVVLTTKKQKEEK